jgi:hypothetical protein
VFRVEAHLEAGEVVFELLHTPFAQDLYDGPLSGTQPSQGDGRGAGLELVSDCTDGVNDSELLVTGDTDKSCAGGVGERAAAPVFAGEESVLQRAPRTARRNSIANTAERSVPHPVRTRYVCARALNHP